MNLQSFTQFNSSYLIGNNVNFYTCQEGTNSFSIVGGFAKDCVIQYNENTTYKRPFYGVIATFKFLKIGNWTGQILKIQAPYANFNFQLQFYQGLNHLCTPDPSSIDEELMINFRFNQNLDSLKFLVTSGAPGSLYWGIREFQIFRTSCNETCASCFGPYDYQCLSCFSNSRLANNNFCTCNDGFYMQIYNGTAVAPSSVCKRCHQTCLICRGEGENNCLSCPFGFNLSNFTCVSSSKLKKL